MLAGMEQVGSRPMLALMLGYDGSASQGAGEQEAGLQLPFDAAQVVNSKQICWVCDNTAKPVSTTWQCHSMALCVRLAL